MNAPIRPVFIAPNLSNISAMQDSAGMVTAAEYVLMASYKFQTDSVLRWINISSEISLGNATINSGAIGVTLGSAPPTAGTFLNRSNSQFIFQHLSQQTLGLVYGSQRVIQIDMDECLVTAGTEVGLYFAALLTTPPPGNIAFSACVSIAHNSLSSWVNFREPRAGVSR